MSDLSSTLVSTTSAITTAAQATASTPSASSPSTVLPDQTDRDGITTHPSAVVTSVPVTISNNGSVEIITVPVTVNVPTYASTSTSTSPVMPTSTSHHTSPALPALGAVLGVIAIFGIFAICVLFRKNRRLSRTARQSPGSTSSEQPETNYSLYVKDTIGGGDNPEELKRQLFEAKKDLAALSVLAPSTIRDQSDYMRDLTLLNDNILQLSMQVSRSQPALKAVFVRSILCNALWTSVLSKFDAGLDEPTNTQMSLIMTRFKKESSAYLWKALTVQHLPLADAPVIAKILEQSLYTPLSGSLQAADTLESVKQSIALSRALAEDGKGFTVSYAKDAQAFELLSASFRL